MFFKRLFGKNKERATNNNLLTRSVSPNDLQVTQRYSSENEVRDKVQSIRALGDYPDSSGVQALLRLLQFDVRGEVSLHASLSLACIEDHHTITEMIKLLFKNAPLHCAAGYPPREGAEVFPLLRLLYPLAWMKKDRLMKEMVEDHPALTTFHPSGKAAHSLVKAVNQGIEAVTESIFWMEYIDEEGNEEIMDLAIQWYSKVFSD